MAESPGNSLNALAASTSGFPSQSSATPTSPRPLKRRRETDATQDLPYISPVTLPDIPHDPDGPYVAPPSPTPTEIVEDPPHESSEERMVDAKGAGVKVRDYAYEPVQKRAPEVWTTPLEALILYDRYLRTHPSIRDRYRPTGKSLYNLVRVGWITDKEAEQNWTPENCNDVREYLSRPNAPYPISLLPSAKRPTRMYRATLRTAMYPVGDDEKHLPQTPESKLYVPEDEPDMDDGPPRIPTRWSMLSQYSSLAQKTGPPTCAKSSKTASAKRTLSKDEDAHARKRRRLSGTPTPADVPPAAKRASARPRRSNASPVGPSTPSSHKTQRSASFSSSRSVTPPAEEPRAPGLRKLGRTTTLTSIPVR